MYVKFIELAAAHAAQPHAFNCADTEQLFHDLTLQSHRAMTSSSIGPDISQQEACTIPSQQINMRSREYCFALEELKTQQLE